MAGILAVIVVAVCGPATAMAKKPTTPSLCPSTTFSQPFLDVGDDDWYTLVGGQTADNFDGTGWTLTDGAGVVPGNGANGDARTVLELPGGSTAVSPPTCVTEDYPHARTMVRDLEGEKGIKVSVEYLGPDGWDEPRKAGRVDVEGTDWTASDPLRLKPDKDPGLQTMRLTFDARGKSSRFQIYNLYIDPRMK